LRVGSDRLVPEASGDCLCFGTVSADGVPSASFSTGEGIEAIIGHDVEAVLAFHPDRS
jgi:hypothetical protein